MKNRKLKINSDFISGHIKGEIVEIQVDSIGVPINPFWRKRLKDAQVDQCCELVEEKAKKPNKSKEDKKHE